MTSGTATCVTTFPNPQPAVPFGKQTLAESLTIESGFKVTSNPPTAHPVRSFSHFVANTWQPDRRPFPRLRSLRRRTRREQRLTRHLTCSCPAQRSQPAIHRPRPRRPSIKHIHPPIRLSFFQDSDIPLSSLEHCACVAGWPIRSHGPWKWSWIYDSGDDE